MSQPPDGVNLFLTWGMIEWILTATLSACGAVAGWVWHLAGRVDKLEDLVANERQEIETVRRTLQDVGNALDRKIDEETQRVEGRMDRLGDKMDELRERIPSRQFIEAQLNNLSGRLDRSLDSRGMGARP